MIDSVDLIKDMVQYLRHIQESDKAVVTELLVISIQTNTFHGKLCEFIRNNYKNFCLEELKDFLDLSTSDILFKTSFLEDKTLNILLSMGVSLETTNKKGESVLYNSLLYKLSSKSNTLFNAGARVTEDELVSLCLKFLSTKMFRNIIKTVKDKESLLYKLVDNEVYDKYIMELLISFETISDNIVRKLVLSGHVNIVNILLSKGFNINTLYEPYNRNLLFYAVEECNDATLKELLTTDININHKDRDGKTPFSFALEIDNDNDILATFLTRKDLIISGENLFCMINKGYKCFTKAHNLPLDYIDSTGETVLFPAVRNGNMTLIQYIVDNKIDINHKNNKGKSVFSYVNDAKILCLLVKNGGVPNKKELSEKSISSIMKTGSRKDITFLFENNILSKFEIYRAVLLNKKVIKSVPECIKMRYIDDYLETLFLEYKYTSALFKMSIFCRKRLIDVYLISSLEDKKAYDIFKNSTYSSTRFLITKYGKKEIPQSTWKLFGLDKEQETECVICLEPLKGLCVSSKCCPKATKVHMKCYDYNIKKCLVCRNKTSYGAY